jgi:hypothetical protein
MPDLVVPDLPVPDLGVVDLPLWDLPPPVCSSLSFDGVSSHVMVPNAPNLNPGKGDFAVEAWVKSTNTAGMLVSKRQGENYYWLETNHPTHLSPVNIWFRSSAGWVVFELTNQGNVNQWTHLAVQREGGTLKVWVNGNPATVKTIPNSGSTNPSDHDINNSGPLYIGRQPLGAYLKGWIAELRITNSAVYSGAFTPTKTFTSLPKTVALYHFDEGQGGTLTDASGNQNHGTIVGATWSNEGPGCP